MISYTISATGAAATIPGTYLYHSFSWNISGGTLSACNIDLEGSDNNTSWSNLIAAQDCSTKGKATLTYGLYKYYRLYVNTITTETGTPRLEVVYYGYIDSPATSGASTMQGVVNIAGSTYADASTQTARLANDASIVVYAQGLVGTANPTYADQALKPLSMDTNGAVRTTITNISSDIDEGLAVTSQAPITIGVQAVADDKAAVDAGDSVRLVSTLAGKLIVLPLAPPELSEGGTATLSGTTDNDFLAADATYKHCLTGMSVINTSETATTVLLYEGGSSAGTLRRVFSAGASNGGHVERFEPALCSAANTKWTAKASASVSTIYVNYNGYKAK